MEGKEVRWNPSKRLQRHRLTECNVGLYLHPDSNIYVAKTLTKVLSNQI